MAHAVTTGIAPTLTLVEGIPTTTSNEVALHFGKRHDNVLQSIASIIAETPAEFTALNFQASEFTDTTGRKLPAYRITRDGFTLLAMGFTGKKALAFKLAYIDAFNRMEAALHSNATQAVAPAAQCQAYLVVTTEGQPPQVHPASDIAHLLFLSGGPFTAEQAAHISRMSHLRLRSEAERMGRQHSRITAVQRAVDELTPAELGAVASYAFEQLYVKESL